MITRRMRKPVRRLYSIGSTAAKALVDSPLFKVGEQLKTKFKREDKLLLNGSLAEMISIQSNYEKHQEKIRKFEEGARRNLFTSNMYVKQLCQDYIRTTKAGYSEFALEVFFRYFSHFLAIKGERTLRREDIDGRVFWDSTFFKDIRKDLMYMCLPGIEVDINCLFSLLQSFERIKYKDYEVLSALTMKLVVEGINPGSLASNQAPTNPFSAEELLKFALREDNSSIEGRCS